MSAPETTRPRPLDGLLVADFTRVLAGPLCTQMLADFGARVIKVEEPQRGDETRRWGPPFVGGTSAYFLSVNRGKESLTLDLRNAADRALAHELIVRADIVIDNFLPAQRETLLGDVLALNPRAVHCSISGFDADTPQAATSGYDLLAQAGGGLMSITGEAEGTPMKIGVALSDVLTAHHAFGAICAALHARDRDDRGVRVEISLFGATLASLVNVAQNVLVTGNEAARFGNAHPSIVPYEVFHGRDRAFAIGAGTDQHFRQLCERVIVRPELARDERFATNASRVAHRGVLVPLLDEIFRSDDAVHWVERCREAAVPASLVQGVREALRSDAGRVLVAKIEHPEIGVYETVRNPVRIDGQRLPLNSAPPALGQQRDALARELTRTTSREEAHRREPGTQ